MEIHADRLEFLLEPSAADAENHASIRKHVECGEFLGEIQGMALRKDYYAGCKPDLGSYRGGVCERNQRIGDGHVLATR
jgi:hypothetical protein